jgi:methylthioribulose-1-phosphate dehydratase
MAKKPNFDKLAGSLVQTGRELHGRGWALGTSGNFSAVLTPDPLRLLISRSGVDKGEMTRGEVVVVDDTGTVVVGNGKPSDETAIHLEVVRRRGAGAVLHTHSVWNTLLSEAAGDAGGLLVEGFEMLKGLSGVTTHEHAEWVPIVENTQDYGRMKIEVGRALEAHPGAHGVLLRGHGLYTWGRDLREARRHVEILEFLFEVTGRLYAATGRLRAPRLAVSAAAGGSDGRRQGS